MLNKYGKATRKIFYPRDRTVVKEECSCTPGFPHWNVVMQDNLGESKLFTSGNEQEVDKLMDLIEREITPQVAWSIITDVEKLFGAKNVS